MGRLHSSSMLLILTGSLLLPWSGGTAQDRRPTVLVIATGGTIASIDGDFSLSGEDMVRALPGLSEIADVSYEEFSQICSCDMTLDRWGALASRIDELFRSNPDLSGVVVTHGTDTMEETAYFLHLTLSDDRPVVVTGAMRAADKIGADGPANLFGAVKLAASDDARGLGTLLFMNDEFHAAREVTKTNALRPDAFESPRLGPLGTVDPDRVHVARRSDRMGGALPPAALSPDRDWPRVDIAYSYVAADGEAIRAFIEAGATGIVVAAFPLGSVSPGVRDAIAKAVEKGVVVVLTGRGGSGRITANIVDDFLERQDDDESPGRVIAGADLTPQKARILLMIALAQTNDLDDLDAFFETY